jgi:hypothetical protein
MRRAGRDRTASERPTPELLLASKRCSQCLTTRSRIVTGERAAQIVRACRSERNHFVCHKGQTEGLVVHCRGVHEVAHGSRAHDFAQAFGIAIREVDPDALDTPSGRRDDNRKEDAER